jgi:hypothetical protein
MKKPLFAESTDVSVEKSISDITVLLLQAGAVAINQEIEKSKVTGLSFVLPYGAGRIPYKLPIRTGQVFKKLQGTRRNFRSDARERDLERAERIAWRQLFWWLKCQLALIDLGMVESAEVLMPYMLGAGGQSFFDTHRQKLIEGGGK